MIGTTTFNPYSCRFLLTPMLQKCRNLGTDQNSSTLRVGLPQHLFVSLQIEALEVVYALIPKIENLVCMFFIIPYNLCDFEEILCMLL